MDVCALAAMVDSTLLETIVLERDGNGMQKDGLSVFLSVTGKK